MTVAPAVLQTIALVAFALLAAGLDLRSRRLPNWLTLGGTVAGLVFAVWTGFPGLLGAAGGAALGLALGMLAFATGILGAGDGKLLMAAGAFLGPKGLLLALLATGVVGGVLGVLDAAGRGRASVALRRAGLGLASVVSFGRVGAMPPRDAAAEGRVPYGVAIAAGALFTWFWGGRLT